jgi:hypothetical protein
MVLPRESEVKTTQFLVLTRLVQLYGYILSRGNFRLHLSMPLPIHYLATTAAQLT